MADYIPQSDADFNIWQSSLITLVQANATTWGILATDVTALVALQITWNAAFGKAANKQNRTSADVQAKDDARAAYEKGLRKFVAQWLTNNSKIADSERERMNITVKSATHTPSPVPASSPVATIDFSVRLQHIINFADEHTPRSKAKPAGVHGCEIWMKVNGAADFTYLATDTATPYIATFDIAQAGQTASYRLRWVNTRGQQGPWSSIVSATVVG